MKNIKHSSKLHLVTTHLEALLNSQTLSYGAKLPSIRQLSRQLAVSTSTVVEAYERLLVQGLIYTRPGAGYYVAEKHNISDIHALKINPEREVDPLWISRQSLESSSDLLKPGCGWLPSSWMPEKLMRKAIKEVAQSSVTDLVTYPHPLGYLPLRQLLSRKASNSGVTVYAEQIMLMDSGTQALDLIFRLFLKDGDCVFIDDPCYFNFHALLKVHRLNIIAIPFEQDGPNIQAFQEAVQQWQPKLYLTNSALHNPTGAALSLYKAYQILKIVEQQHMVIIEDDIFADLEHHIAPRYAALGGFEHVIQVTSFSKTISAAIRCGAIMAKPIWIDRLINLKVATVFSHNTLNSKIIYAILTNSQYRRYVDHLKIKLQKHMTQTINRLTALDIQPWLIPTGGMFLWCQLPNQLNSTALSKACFKAGVMLAPGQVFSQSESAQHFLRFNVSQSQDPKIYQVLAENLSILTTDASR
ncbi:aminotransferase-like domain-containing protein [Acinetobacter larvae]|uniref:GntR family transcriptional regulator n=1 Tax=Acinetobacter larvae TaxID=1789224 RepID=A0A1B2M4D9_9GAMM|nr:PLP-dependent aminotransferase family protein [Acinetobacter larvae]AOA60034.1 GntR family transcriptional regulator [Acinetobacter larvae]